MNYKEKFIEFMVKSEVLKFGEFITKSGRETPYFINAGNYNNGMQASLLADYYAECFYSLAKGKSNVLFGPAYKGIPLAVTTAVALYKNYDYILPYAFNRKEEKDHGEGGTIIGYTPVAGDKVAIIDDVVTAGTAVRESINFLKKYKDVSVTTLLVSVDRMEKGTKDKSTYKQLEEDFGIEVISIVNIKEIVQFLHNKEIDGKVYIDDKMKENIENYLLKYGIAND